MKLRAIKFLQSVLIEGKQVEAAPLGEASAVGVVVTCSPVVLVPWHMVRYAEVVEAKPEQEPADLDKPWTMTVDGIKNVGPTAAGQFEAMVDAMADELATTPKRKRGKL